jgi:hypothetical protein
MMANINLSAKLLHDNYTRARDAKSFTVSLLAHEVSKKQRKLCEKLESSYELTLAKVSEIWTCVDSPIGFCFYDRGVDPMLDRCIICGDPNERK